MTQATVARVLTRTVWIVLTILIVITLVFAVRRVFEDVPHLVDRTSPSPGRYGSAYVAVPWAAYLHIVPGILYLVGAPLQLSRRFRSRHLRVHRILGRILLPLGLLSGVFALIFGGLFAFGGAWESLAAVLFGSWFILSLLLAYRAIRALDVTRHRRWMIRAFAVGLGVGTIRIWIGLLTLAGLPLRSSFAVAFWIGLSLHVIAAELWLWWRPGPSGRPRPSRRGGDKQVEGG